MGLIKVGTFLSENKERLGLELVAGQKGLDSIIISLELNRPGLALAGFVDLCTYNRVQLIGNTELLYLNNLKKKERIEAFEKIAKPINDKIIANCQQTQSVEVLRNTLLPKLMSGEVLIEYEN